MCPAMNRCRRSNQTRMSLFNEPAKLLMPPTTSSSEAIVSRQVCQQIYADQFELS